VRWAARAATEAGLGHVVIVTAPDADEVRAATEEFDLIRVENAAPRRGLASSLGLGVQAVAGSVDAVVVLLADMPWVRGAHVRRLLAAFDPALRRVVCVPTYQGRRGNPVVWGARFFDDIRALEGDRGARVLMERHAPWVHEVAIDDAAVLRDIDTLADWRAAGGESGTEGDAF
jgi:molybdenum cofactor cytidylyltransferase